MENYLNSDTFITLLEMLRENKSIKINAENLEDGKVSSYKFKKIKFGGYPAILYVHPYAFIGILQDTPNSYWQDDAEDIFEILENEGRCKVSYEFI